MFWGIMYDMKVWLYNYYRIVLSICR